MKAGAIVFLIFVGLAALAMFTDAFDSVGGDLSGVFDIKTPGESATPATPTDAGKEAKEQTVEGRVAALEEDAAALRRRVRDVVDSTSALAGTDTALAAILARLAELTGAVGRLPRDDVAAQLDILERDFELREFMVTGTKEVVDKGPDEVVKELDRLRKQAAKLRKAASGKEDLLARLMGVADFLKTVEAPPEGGEVKELDAVKKARARFDKGVATLRTRLG